MLCFPSSRESTGTGTDTGSAGVGSTYRYRWYRHRHTGTGTSKRRRVPHAACVSVSATLASINNLGSLMHALEQRGAGVRQFAVYEKS